MLSKMVSLGSKRFLLCVGLALILIVSGDDEFDHPNKYLLPEVCGESQNSDKIIGGTNASIGQYPWLAQVGYVLSKCPTKTKPIYRCGGSVISERYVVTAAHCVVQLPKLRCDGYGIQQYRVARIRLGEYYTEKEVDCVDSICAEPVQDFAPVKIIVHLNYNKPRFKNDIALIRLDRKINFNGWVGAICLPRGAQLSRSFIGRMVEVAGWGVTTLKKDTMSKFLLYVSVPIIETEFCAHIYDRIIQVGHRQICAGGVTGKDSCQGDSGGPAMIVDAYEGPPKYYLVGLVSFGPSKCGVTRPAVYTRITSYVYWILSNMEP